MKYFIITKDANGEIIFPEATVEHTQEVNKPNKKGETHKVHTISVGEDLFLLDEHNVYKTKDEAIDAYEMMLKKQISDLQIQVQNLKSKRSLVKVN